MATKTATKQTQRNTDLAGAYRADRAKMLAVVKAADAAGFSSAAMDALNRDTARMDEAYKRDLATV